MKIDKKILDRLVNLQVSMIGEDGLEYPNPTAEVVTVGARRFTLQEQIERVLRGHVSEQAQGQGFESFEEANDFDVEDEDPLPISGFEHEDMEEEIPPPVVSTPEPPVEEPALVEPIPEVPEVPEKESTT